MWAGRVARAGRSGTAFSLVAPDELPYVLDLHLFLGRPLNWATPGRKYTGRFFISKAQSGIFNIISENISE